MAIKTNKQSGFTVLEFGLALVVVALLVAIGFLAYKRGGQTANVSTGSSTGVSQQQKIAAKTADTEKTEEIVLPPAPEPAKPAPAPTPPPTQKAVTPTEPKKTYTYLAITMNDAQIGDSTVLFGASWSGSYSGTCAVKAKHLTNGTSQYKEVPVSGSSCAVEIAKTDFATGEWKYLVYFYSKDGTVKGEGSYKTFTL